jgi:hypothetical protein
MATEPTIEERAKTLTREIAKVAVAPMEGHPLEFGLALEMAVTNVVQRIQPLIISALQAERADAERNLDAATRMGYERGARDAEREALERAKKDGRYLPSHAVAWAVVNDRICRRSQPHQCCEFEPGPDEIAAALVRVLVEAGMQAHKHGCENRLVRPAQWYEDKPCAGCEAEQVLRALAPRGGGR